MFVCAYGNPDIERVVCMEEGYEPLGEDVELDLQSTESSLSVG
jgi:hypothetical protein